MKPVYDTISDRDRAFVFLLKHMSMRRTDDQKGICLMRDGVVQAACVYDEWNGSNIFMHCAGAPGRRWLNREFLRWAFDYPFNQLHCRRITLWIEANNRDSVRFAEHLGFTQETVLKRAAHDGSDVLLYVMFREDCRYA